jgi:DNA-binding winged helix-turn-helix (wHTH) protein
MKYFESFGLDTLNECLWKNGAQISLPPKPFAVLRYLVENPARLITHDELLDALWPETYVQPQVLRTYMLELRKVLGDDAGQPRFIQTLPKRGYRFVAAVVDASSAEPLRNGTGKQRDPETARQETKTSETIPETGITKIVGRDEELDRLMSLADALKTGQRQVVFITGEAGIGKTALVDSFVTSFQRFGPAPLVCIARGQCVEGFGGKEQYYPVMEALSHLCASPDGETACRILGRMAPAWLASLGREAEALTVPTRHAAEERMPGDLCAALEELATEMSLILIFEDVHWADESTLHLISALARRRAAAKLMVLATYRPQAGLAEATEHLRKGLKQDLLMRRLCVEIALAPLAKTAVRDLLSRELKQETLPPGLASFVYRHSEGNPLFVIAVLEHLIAQQYLIREATDGAPRWEQQSTLEEAEAGVPEGLTQMIELEMERLSLQERRILEAGSLMSVAFPAWAVAAALEEDEVETEEACDELARRLYFLERAGEDELPNGTCTAFYVFAHGLYREVLYHRQSATRRARRHVRIAERLGRLFAGREAHVAREMAMHYEAAEDWPSAASALRSAAQHAFDRQAHAEAAELLEHALEIAQSLNEFERVAAAREIGKELMAAREALAEYSNLERKLSTKA